MKIKVRSKTKTIYKIYFDDKIWGVLPEKTLRNFFTVWDKETTIDAEIIKEIKCEIIQYSWKRLLDFIAYRERSTGEAVRFLKSLPLETEIAQGLISRAQTNNYLNDERFTEMMIDDMIARGKSSREISSKLYQAGVESGVVSRIMQEKYPAGVQESILEEAVEKALVKYRMEDARKRDDKIINYLARRGFPIGDVIGMLREKRNEETDPEIFGK